MIIAKTLSALVLALFFIGLTIALGILSEVKMFTRKRESLAHYFYYGCFLWLLIILAMGVMFVISQLILLALWTLSGIEVNHFFILL